MGLWADWLPLGTNLLPTRSDLEGDVLRFATPIAVPTRIRPAVENTEAADPCPDRTESDGAKTPAN